MGGSSAEDKTVALRKAAQAGPRGARETALPLRTKLAGRYEIVDLLGEGGMGAVYLAIDEALGGKPVALKVVGHEVAGESDLEELRREVLYAQKVTHRNVCRIHDLERIDGRWMIKMECVYGETLGVRVARAGRLGIDEALGIARQIVAGLGAAHAQGVVHRDLKPANVMIEDGTGRVVLMDFGIARGAGGEAATDHAGTPQYMAPEQIRDQHVDARSDVYAVGSVLYHMLIGEVAFPASTSEGAEERTVRDAPPDPRARRADLPGWLAKAILEMLAKGPAQRPADAAAVERLLEGPSRTRGLIAAAAAVAVVAIAGGVVIARAGSRAPWHPTIREIEPGYDENSDGVVFSPDGTRIAYSTDRDHPGWLRARVRTLATSEDVAVTGTDTNAIGVGWTHDGKSLLYTDAARDMTAFEIPVTGGAAVTIGPGYAIDCGGKLLRFELASPGCPKCPRFVLREAGGGEREVLRLDSNAFVTTYRCDRGGTRVAWSRAEQGAPFYNPADLWIADVATGAARQLTHDRKRNAYPSFTPEGRSLVFTSARGGGVMNLWELPLDGGEPVQLTFGEGNDLMPDVSADGTRVVFDVDVTSAPVFAHHGDAKIRVTPARVILIDPQVTPDGKEIVAADFAPLTSRIVAVRIDDGSVRPLADGVIATVTPDGKEVVFAQDGVPARIASVPRAGGTPRALAELAGRVRELRAGPDGQIHAMLDRGATLEAWRVPLAGGPPAREADAPWCFVQPAPAGGWSLWMRCAGQAPTEGVLVAPGAAPDPSGRGARMRGPMFFGGDFTARGDAFIGYDQPRVVRIDVATGAITTLFETALYGATVSPDGATVYTTEPVGSARRHLITNFADRPRP